jgi:cytochrome bd-type quinol oxidase subunit 2
LSPFFVFLVIGLGIVCITVKDSKLQKRTRWLDGVIFLVTGIVGILLLVLWFGTDHTATANNYNILWAFPLNLFFCSLIWSRAPKKWLRRYVFFLIIILALLIALFVRYVYLARYLKE